MAAAQQRAVDQVVVDERRRVHELDRDGRAHEALLSVGRLRRPAGGLRGEHDEQRAQALAAGEHGGVGVGGERRAGLRGHPLEVALGALHALSQAVAAAAHDRVESVDLLHAERLPPCCCTALMMPVRRALCPRGSRRCRRR